MFKKFFLSFCILYSCLAGAGTTDAAIQLDNDIRPNNLPTFENSEAVDPDHPETAATQSLILFVGSIISQALLFAGGLTILFLMIAGINYVFAFGKDERIERGKRGLLWSIIGLVVILLSYAIVQGIIQVVLQIDESVT